MAPMPRSAIVPPSADPTPIFELFRGSYGTELLPAAVAHFDLFGTLATPRTCDELRAPPDLAGRPAVELVTAMRPMGLLTRDESGRLSPSGLASEPRTNG